MLRERVLVVVGLLPLGLTVVAWGGWPFVALVALLVGLAAWEYAGLFVALGRRPARGLVVLGAVAFVGLRAWGGFAYDVPLLAALTLLSMAWHLRDYEKGAAESGTDFAITLAGAVYVGFLGSFLVALRQLPEGLWWFLLALPTIWLADSGAYFFGRALGRHPLSPRLSPKKTWEGYLAGVVTGVLGALGLAAAWNAGWGPIPGMDAARAAALGLVISVLAPLGDLGESLFKRQAGVKDSGNLLPGHGGVFDRVDSWLWAGVLAYALIWWWR